MIQIRVAGAARPREENPMNPSLWLLTHADDAQFALFAGAFALVAVAERAFSYRALAPERRKRWTTNLGLTALNVFALGVLPMSFVAAAHVAEQKDVGLLHTFALAPALFVASNLLLRGFVSFVTHLLMHKVPLFWRVHRVHHLDTDLDVSTTVRFHPLEFVIGLAIGLPFVVGFGLSPWLLALYELCDIVVTLFSHADLRLPPLVERLLRPFVVTPGLHRVHHSTHPDETDSNFSAVFPIWDIVFGTFRATTRDDPRSMPLGLEEVRGPRAQNLGWLLTVPFRSALGGPAQRGLARLGETTGLGVP
jgi:sterol desaturase/sphingolipid hydroxylase (fatty acid hydroxylase superfamily)